METGTSAEPAYHLHPVSIPGFEGPLDLLLSLIEAEKLDINQISLATVTDQYFSRLKDMGDLPPEHLADFLVVAASLLLLKSRRLFPQLILTEEEEEHVASLEEQLREYRRFREAGKTILGLWNRNTPLWSREAFLGLTATFYPPPNFSVADLRRAIDPVLLHLPKLGPLAEEVVKRIVSLEECIREIQRRIAVQSETTFSSLAQERSSRTEMIVSFLALLELVKQRAVVAKQRQAFAAILVRRGE